VTPTDAAAIVRHDDSPRRERLGGLLAMALFFGAFGGWAALAPLDAAVVAAGEVKVSGNRQVIQHREGGVISRVLVKEGDHVAVNQVLVELSADALVAEEQALAGQTIELQASRERLLAEAGSRLKLNRPPAWSNLPSEYGEFAESVLRRQERELITSLGALGSRVSVLTQRQRETDARIQGYAEQIKAIDEQSALVSEELTGLQELARDGFAAETRVRAMQRSASELRERRAELLATIEQSKEAIGETRMQTISTRQDRASQIAEELRVTDTRLSDVAPRWKAVRLQLDSTRVRANTAGKVVGLAFYNEGAVVGPGDRILDLVPDERGVVMQVRIRPIDADNVVAGQTTMVRFSALEGRQVPFAHGRVEHISADRFEDPHNGQPYFLADVHVDAAEITTLARAAGRATLAVTPGLPVEIVIPLRKRSALQYLIEPLQQSLWRAFREG
jgi:HlyD family secretion protein